MKAEDDLKDRAEARVGKVLRDKWVLDRLLGLGGMAAVYSATHRNGKHAAIKILHPEAALVPDIRARFLREGYLANKVGHAGTVSILDDDVDVDGTVFLVMELLSGETLESAWLHSVDSRLPWEFALVVAYQVLDVLHAAHQKNIVHRDLKPANIFLDATGKAKVLDFGIARLHTASPVGGTGRDTALGTPGYMPPEQARGHWDKVDAQSDLWALGATLFATLAARLVHDGTTVNEQLLSAMTQPAPALGSVAPEIPAEVAAIVDRALAFEKAQRWSDARAMQEEVRRVYELLKGKSIAQAGPLAITVRARSVAPDAPTVAADQSSTARPVGRSATTARKQRRLQLPLLFVGGAVLALGTAAMLFKRGPASEPELGQKASAAIAPAVLATTAAALPVEPPPVEPPAAAPSASASAPASAAPKVAVAPGPHKARPKPSARAASKAAPAVAADFDLNRRK